MSNSDMGSSSIQLEPKMERSSTLAMLALCIAATMVTLDLSLINTALPTISEALGVTASTAIWLVTAYQISVIGLLLPFASLSEIVGHKRMFFYGLALFTVSSLVAGVFTDLPWLIVARCLQGIGGAAVGSVVTALIKRCYPADQLGRGMGIYALVVGLSFTAGPTVAAGILAVSNWHCLFLVNVPVGIYCLYLSRRYIPVTSGSKGRFDLIGGVLCCAMFILLILSLVAFARGGVSAVALFKLLGAFFCFALLSYHQRKHAAPMLAIDLFKQRNFAFSSLTSICAFVTQGVAFIALPFFFHTFLSATPFMTGMLITPWPAVVACMAIISGMLSDRFNPGTLCTAGLLILATGMFTLCFLPEKVVFLDIAWRMMICGAGFGLYQAPNLKMMISSAPLERSGSASAIVALSRLLGQSFGAVLVSFAYNISPDRGPYIALGIGVAFALLGGLFSAVRKTKGIETRTFNGSRPVEST